MLQVSARPHACETPIPADYEIDFVLLALPCSCD